jgi:RHS repeat-associated protein
VRSDHPLRRVAGLVDFKFVRGEVADCYGSKGQVSVDPEVIMKMMFLLFFDDVASERELMKIIAGKTATGNRFLFGGREYFSSIGLYNYRNRFYSPAWGRFLQPDPIGFGGDSASLYRYCGNNPVNGSDPSGLGGGVEGHLPDEDPSTQEILTGKKDKDIFASNFEWVINKILEALNRPQAPTGPFYVPPPGSDAKVAPGQPIPTAVPPPVSPDKTPPPPPSPTPKPPLRIEPGIYPAGPGDHPTADFRNAPFQVIWGDGPWAEPWGIVPTGRAIVGPPIVLPDEPDKKSGG